MEKHKLLLAHATECIRALHISNKLCDHEIVYVKGITLSLNIYYLEVMFDNQLNPN